MAIKEDRPPWRHDADGPACWLFDPRAARIVLANRSALALFGEQSLLALSERRFAPGEALVAVARAVMDDERARTAPFDLDFGAGRQPTAIEVAPADLPDGRKGVMMTALPASGAHAPDDASANLARRAAALDALAIPVLITDGTGHIHLANAAADTLTPPEAKTLADRLGPTAARIVAEALAGGGHFSRSLDIQPAQGPGGAAPTAWRGHVEARRMRDPIDGTALDILVLNDLRALAAVETAFASERDALKALIDVAADFTFETAADGRIAQVSDGFRRLTGLAPDAVIGKRWTQLSPYLEIEEDAELTFAAAPDRFEDLPLTLNQADGPPLKVLLSATARRTANGRFEGYRGTGRRARGSGDQTSTAPYKRLLALLHASDEALLVVDGEGRVRFANRAAGVLFGEPPEALENTLAANLFVPASRSTLSETLASGESGEALVRNAHGADIPVSIHVRLLDTSRPPILCFILRDLSASKLRESELIAARDKAAQESKQKSEFLARISHELRTPLNAIIGFSEIMRDGQFGPVGNPRYEGYLKDIHHSAHLLLSLVNDLIDLSKIGAGGLALKFSTVDLSKILERCVSLLMPQALQAGVTIESRIAPGLPPLHADARSLEQILINLVSNAIKFTPPGGNVLVSAAVTGEGTVTLVVRDSGIGMSREELLTALEPYKRVERPDVLSKPGTGIGLPLAKALAEANHAQFRIDSRPQAGTAVEIRFPGESRAG